MKNTLFFSILIPNLGYSPFLFKCLDSVYYQKHNNSFDYEILLCDQSDESIFFQIKEEVEKRYSGAVKLIRLETKSVTLARHKLISESSGTYVYFIDSDDFVDDNLLEEAFSKINKSGFPDVFLIDFLICDENGIDYDKSKKPSDFKNHIMDYFIYANYINSLCVKLFKRQLYERNDYSDFSNGNGEDYVMSYPIMKKAKTIVYDETMFKYHYRQRKFSRVNSISFSDLKISLERKNDCIDFVNMNNFQKKLLYNNVVPAFSYGAQNLIKSHKITKPQFFEVFFLLRTFLLKNKVDFTFSDQFNSRIIGKLVIYNKPTLLWMALRVKSYLLSKKR